MVIAAVLASGVAALVPDKVIADLLGGGAAPSSQQTNAGG